MAVKIKSSNLTTLPFKFNKGRFEHKPLNADIKLYECDFGDGYKIVYLSIDKPNRDNAIFATDILTIFPDGSITLDANIDLRKAMI